MAQDLDMTAMAGRENDTARLTELLDRAISGKGRLVFLAGEAGIGKTRVMKTLAQYATSQGAVVLQGTCLFREGTDPYLPLIDALRSYPRKAAALEAGESAAVAAGERPPELMPIGLIGMDEDDRAAARKDAGESDVLERLRRLDLKKERARMYETVSSSVIAMSEKHPLLLFIDDLHWADSATLQLLAYLAGRIQGSQVLILGAYRPEELSELDGKPHVLTGTIQSLQREGLSETVTLRRLGEAETRQLLVRILGRGDLPEGLAGLLFKQSEGNPFFIEEMLKGLLDRGTLDPAGGIWPQRVDPGMLALPSSVKAVLTDRVARLDPRDVKALEGASVIGQEFTFPVLQAISESGEEELVDSIDRLLRADLLREETVGGQERYRFARSMLREVIYDNLSRTRRKLMHRKVAAALEASRSKNLDDIIYQLAHHYSIAGEPDKAALYLSKAGHKAMKSFAFEEAMAYCRQALELLEKLEPSPENRAREAEVLLSVADMDFYKGEWESAVKAFGKVLMLAEETGNEMALAHCYLMMGTMDEKQGNWDRSSENLARAQALYEKLGDADGQVRVLLSQGMTMLRKAEFKKAIAYYLEKRPLVESTKDPCLLAMWTMNLAVVNTELGDHENAERYFLEAERLAKEANDPYELSRAYNNLGDLRMRQWRYKDALPLFEKSIEAGRKSGQLRTIAYALSNLGESLVNLGETEKAKVYLERAEALFEKTGDRLMISRMRMIEGVIHRKKNEWDLSKQQHEKSLKLAENLGVPLARAEYLLEYGITCREAGQKEEARSRLGEAAAIFKKFKAEKYFEKAEEELKLIDAGS